MAIVIKEYTSQKDKNLKENFIEVNVPESDIPGNIDIDEAAQFTAQADTIMVDIESIHGYPHATRNFTRYMPEALRNSVKTWTEPYKRPMILHHNESDGITIGRIVAAEYVPKKTKTGTPALVFSVNIADKNAIDQVNKGILETTSIGVMANKVKCSICGQEITKDGLCEHERGQKYGKEICYWDIYDMEGKECSYVIVPSDIYSGNIKIYKPKTSVSNVVESLNIVNGIKEGKDNSIMTEEEIKALQLALEESKNKVTALETEKEEVVGKLTASESKVVGLESELKEEKEKAQKATTDLEEATKNLETEKALRVTLEEQLHTEEKNKKKKLVETIVALRSSIGGKSEVNMEEMLERSMESLNDSVQDLTEELRIKNTSSNQNNIPTIVNDPTLHQEESVNTKKEKTIKIDAKEELNNIISGCYKKY